MKARIRYASCSYTEEKEFDTLQDLLDWKSEIDEDIIIEHKIDFIDMKDYDIYIEVYDDYLY